MDSSDIKGLFHEYKLDWDDPYTEGFVMLVSTAIVKLYGAFKEEQAPFVAFNEFVEAREFFYFMPETTQKRTQPLMDDLDKMWEDVSSSKADQFCCICAKVAQGNNEQSPELCEICIEILEAIFALDGKLPEAQRIFDAAHHAAMSKSINDDACIALLFIVCGRLWYKCLGYSCTEEEILLSEGIRYHLKAREKGGYNPSNLYCLHVSSAIYDSTFVRLSKGIHNDEMLEFIKSAYELHNHLEPEIAHKQNEQLYKLTGIPSGINSKDNLHLMSQFPASDLPN